MCENQWDCKGNKSNCMFRSKDNISFEEFYKRTRLCKCYHDNGSCEYTDKSDWVSFVDFAELLWYPRAYTYKTALKLLHLKKLAEEAIVAIPEEINGIVDWETINNCNKYIRKELRKRNTKDNEDYDKVKEWVKDLWSKADELPWRDEDEWQQINSILNDKENCGAIELESFKNSTDFSEFLSETEDGKLKCEENYSEKNSGNFVPLSVTVSTEDNSMTDRKKVDVLLQNKKKNKSIAVELKQWTESQLKPLWEKDINPELEEEKKDKLIGFKVIGSKGREWVKLHPVIQAANYAMLICNSENRETVENMKSPDPLNTDEVKRFIKNIIKNYPDEAISCIPLVYLHNQYYENGLLFKLAKETPLSTLYFKYLSAYTINNKQLFSMFTRHKCGKMIDIIQAFLGDLQDAGKDREQEDLE